MTLEHNIAKNKEWGWMKPAAVRGKFDEALAEARPFRAGGDSAPRLV